MTAGEQLFAMLSPHSTPMGVHDGERGSKWRVNGVEIILRHEPNDGDFVDLVSLVAAVQSQGAGSAALALLCAAADTCGVKLDVYARAMDGRPHSTARLVRWYARHGFVLSCDNGVDWSAGRDLVDEDHAGCDMLRSPGATCQII